MGLKALFRWQRLPQRQLGPVLGLVAWSAVWAILRIRDRRRRRRDGREDSICEDASAASGDLPQSLATVLLDEEIAVTVSDLWLQLFNDSEMYRALHATRGTIGLNVGEWHQEKGGQMTREIVYVTPLKRNPLGPRTAECVERQRCQRRTSQAIHVVVHCHTAKVPFGKAFHIELQWAATSLGSGRCRLRVTSRVMFTEACLMRGLIERHALQGLRETYSLTRAFLHTRFPAAPPAGRALAPSPSARKEAERQTASYARTLATLMALLVVAATLAILVQLNLAAVGTRLAALRLRTWAALQALATVPPLLTP